MEFRGDILRATIVVNRYIKTSSNSRKVVTLLRLTGQFND